MARLRTVRRFVPWLIGLFVIAQLAGVVPRFVSSEASIIALVSGEQLQHAHIGINQTDPHQHSGAGLAVADGCCALHLLNGLVSLVATSVPLGLIGEPLSQVSITNIAGIEPTLLFRPPRPSLSV